MVTTYGSLQLDHPTADYIAACNAQPAATMGLEVVEHKSGGYKIWGAATIDLYFARRSGMVSGDAFRNEIADKPALGGNVLDYLLAHPELIPDSWRGQAVFFWGTIYRRSDKRLCVRCLIWGAGAWYSSHRLLEDFWTAGMFPAAVATNLP